MKIDKKVNKLLDGYVKNVLKEIEDEYWSTVAEVANEMGKKAEKIYETYIDQFYSYKTTSYIRHGMQKPGVGGENLYRGFNYTVTNNGKNPKLVITYSGLEMDKLMGIPYKYDDADTVLNYVIEGVRFPYYNHMSWSGDYVDYDFISSGSIQEAIDKFDAEFYDIAEKKFIRKWHNKKWF